MVYGKEYEQCESCRYFLQHYIKKNTSFQRTRCGHCVNRQLNGSRVRKKYELHKNCEYWESNEEKICERRVSIEETLRYIEEHLNEIAIILKDDSNSAADD